ncbi:MAG TPA: hypothetical protein PKA99_11600 [Dermatophilaceae bacterium]|nr:hypothetical protein [Dermatophilaceae bacterium]
MKLAPLLSQTARPVWRREPLLTALTVAVGWLFLMVPRPSGWVGEHVHKEDGEVFLTDFLARGWASVFDVYSGYLHVGPRLIVGGCASALPPEAFAGCVTASVNGFRAFMAVLVAAALAAYLGRDRLALVAGAGMVLLPAGQMEILGNVTNMRWILVASATILLLARLDTWASALVGSAVLGLAALSDPLALALVPVALLRVLTWRGVGRLAPGVFLAAAAGQAVMMRTGDRQTTPGAALLGDPVHGIQQVVVRWGAGWFGITPVQVLCRLGTALAATVVIAAAVVLLLLVARRVGLTRDEGHLVLLLGAASVAFLMAALAFADLSLLSLGNWWTVADSARYSTLAGVLWFPVVVIVAARCWDLRRSVRWSGPAALILGLSIVVGVLADARGDTWNTNGPTWPATVAEARASCDATGQDPTVSVTPVDVAQPWTAQLTCRWLGK